MRARAHCTKGLAIFKELKDVRGIASSLGHLGDAAREACREHAELAGLPVDDVVAVNPEIGPAQFK